MRPIALAVLLAMIAATGAEAATPCDQPVDFSSEAAIIAALKPKSREQIEACPPRGLRFAPNPTANTHSTSRPAEPAALSWIDMPILFATDSADVLPEGRQILQNIARALANPELRQYRFRIEGHTDSTGSVAHNRDLSWRRAVSVMRYLQESAGIEAKRLEPVGYGPDRPAVPRPPGTAEPRNRRVQLVNIGA